MQPINRGRREADSAIIRLATEADLESILGIYNHAVLNTTATYDYEPKTMPQRKEWFENHKNDGLPVFVADHPGAGVVGWSSLNKYHDRPGFRFTCENSIYVSEDWRGQGLGARLLEPLVRSARLLGKRTILALIDAENPISVRLHERHGFIVAGRLRHVGFKFGRWLDLVIMECHLEAPAASILP